MNSTPWYLSEDGKLTIGPDLELLKDAAGVACARDITGPAVIQRRVRVGFAKAARLVTLLEQYGVLSAPDEKGRMACLMRGEEEKALAVIQAAADAERGTVEAAKDQP